MFVYTAGVRHYWQRVLPMKVKKGVWKKGKDKGTRGGNLDKNFHATIDDVFKRQDGSHFPIHLVWLSGTRKLRTYIFTIPFLL
jgi:hypothetical protein